MTRRFLCRDSAIAFLDISPGPPEWPDDFSVTFYVQGPGGAGDISASFTYTIRADVVERNLLSGYYYPEYPAWAAVPEGL